MIEIFKLSDDLDGFEESFAAAPYQMRKGIELKGALPAPILAGLVKLQLPKPKEFWLATSGGEPVAQLGANVALFHEEVGFVGFFEFDTHHPDGEVTARALIDLANEWLQSQGCTKVYGPINYNTWFPYRFRTSTNDEIKFGWEPIHSEKYPKIFEDAGFEVCESYHSQGLDGLASFVEGTRAAYERAVEMGYTFRPFDRETLFQRDVPSIYRISMAGFSENFLFEPIPEKAFVQLYVPVADKMDLSLAHIVSDSSGQDVAFFFCYEDQDYIVYKSVAVMPSHRGKGLSNAVAHICGRRALERGITKMITAMVKDGAQSESYGRRANELWKHTYSLYARNISEDE